MLFFVILVCVALLLISNEDFLQKFKGNTTEQMLQQRFKEKEMRLNYVKPTPKKDSPKNVSTKEEYIIKLFDKHFREFIKVFSFSVRVSDRSAKISESLSYFKNALQDQTILQFIECPVEMSEDELKKTIKEEENYKRNGIENTERLESAEKTLRAIEENKLLSAVKNGNKDGTEQMASYYSFRNEYKWTYWEERLFIEFIITEEEELEKNGYVYGELINIDKIYKNQHYLLLALEKNCFGYVNNDSFINSLKTMFKSNYETSYYRQEEEEDKRRCEQEEEEDKRRREREAEENAKAGIWLATPATGDYFYSGSAGDDQCVRSFDVCRYCIHKHERIHGHACRRYGGRTWSD